MPRFLSYRAKGMRILVPPPILLVASRAVIGPDLSCASVPEGILEMDGGILLVCTILLTLTLLLLLRSLCRTLPSSIYKT
jgi:hypothetical protein